MKRTAKKRSFASLSPLYTSEMQDEYEESEPRRKKRLVAENDISQVQREEYAQSDTTESSSEAEDHSSYPALTVYCKDLIGNLPPSWNPVVELERIPNRPSYRVKQV